MKKRVQQNKRRILISLLIILWITPVGAQQGLPRVYDEEADPIEQLDNALRQAQAEGKHVLCQVGGNWCPWCLILAHHMSQDSTARALVGEHYVYIHLNYNPRKQLDGAAKEKTEAMLSRVGNPTRFGYPVLVVLTPDGQVLHIQDSSFLEEGRGYNSDKVARFLRCWTPKALKG